MRIGLLGPVEVTKGDTPVSLGGAKQRALLALLAVHAGRVVSDDRILEELWRDAQPDNPSNALQKRVSELRKAMGPDRILRQGDGYMLDVATEAVDALAFEQMSVDGGGAGKTRLAIEIGAALADGGAAAVWLIELAPLIDGVAVPEAVAAAMSARETSVADPSVPVVERIRRQLHGREVVLILDNCEHVIDAAAAITAALLDSCPGIRVLATSREPSAVRGEAQVPVTSMVAAEAERLFVERAQAIRPGFVPDGDTRLAVAQACRRLDGLPLAIELAASRVKALPVEHIVRRLDDRFHLLTGGGRTALPRHQTLRAAVDWSYDLLFQDERALFDHLAVFPGGCDHDDAEAVCGTVGLDAENMVDLLGRLVDKS